MRICYQYKNKKKRYYIKNANNEKEIITALLNNITNKKHKALLITLLYSKITVTDVIKLNCRNYLFENISDALKHHLREYVTQNKSYKLFNYTREHVHALIIMYGFESMGYIKFVRQFIRAESDTNKKVHRIRIANTTGDVFKLTA